MTDRWSEEEALLAQARSAWTPTDADAERVRRATQARLGLHEPLSDLAPEIPRTGASSELPLLAAGAKWFAGAILIAAAAFGGYALGLRDGRATSEPVAEPTAQKAGPPPAETKTSAHSSAQPLAPAPPAPAADPQPPAADVRATHRTSLPLSARRAHARSAEPAFAPSLRAELRALKRVDRALRDDRPELALRVLAELDREVPHGQMLEERAAGHALARCAKQPSSGVAASFSEQHPNSVYAARILTACEGND